MLTVIILFGSEYLKMLEVVTCYKCERTQLCEKPKSWKVWLT